MCREKENTIASRTITTNEDMRTSSNLSSRILKREISMIINQESQTLGNIKKDVEKMILNIEEVRLKFKIRKIKIE